MRHLLAMLAFLAPAAAQAEWFEASSAHFVAAELLALLRQPPAEAGGSR